MEANRLSNPHMVKVQTLFGGNKTKFLPVTNSLPVGELLLTGTISEIITQHFATKEEPKASLTSERSVKGGENPKAQRVEAS